MPRSEPPRRDCGFAGEQEAGTQCEIIHTAHLYVDDTLAALNHGQTGGTTSLTESRKRMKPISLAGTALLALLALEPAAHAQRVNFTYTGKLVTYTVPTTGLYQITAYGAQGGSVVFPTGVGQGGLGAEISGDFTLTT